jgi:two-component system sensor histidine kinase TctE
MEWRRQRDDAAASVADMGFRADHRVVVGQRLIHRLRYCQPLRQYRLRPHTARIALDIGRQIKVLRGRIYIDLPEVAVQMLRSREADSLYYLVTGPDKEYISGEPDLKPSPLPPSEQVRYYDDTYRGAQVRVAVVQFPVDTEDVHGQVSVQVAETLPARTDLLREVLIQIALPQVLLGIIAIVMLWFAVGRGLAPLHGLREAIEQRSHRDLAALPVTQSPREVRPLIDAMNGLMQRLGAALNAQQRFIADRRAPVAYADRRPAHAD